MARLQILELPEGSSDDRPPFALIVDQYEPAEASPEQFLRHQNVAEQIGARAVLVFEETIDIPANDTSAYIQQAAEETGATIGEAIRAANALQLADERTHIARDMDRLTKWKNELADALGIGRGSSWDDIRNAAAGLLKRAKHADKRCEELRAESLRRGKVKGEYAEKIRLLEAQLEDARQWARHGYEIGQRHCGWTDHGAAPDWLTGGWPPHFDSCEHLKQAAEFDEALTRVRNLPTEPEVMNAKQEHPNVWKHGYHCGVLAAKTATRSRNEPTTKPTDA